MATSFVDTTQPTSEEEPYIVTYTVKDAAGNAAYPALRYVHVVCPVGKQVCTTEDGTLSCGSSGSGTCDTLIPSIVTPQLDSTSGGNMTTA